MNGSSQPRKIADLTSDGGPPIFPIPYNAIVGQNGMKQALELAYVEPGIHGVLLTGERGTAKSTLARAFAGAILDKPLVTLPINATEDRVVGGLDIEWLIRYGDDPRGRDAIDLDRNERHPKERPGLIEQADEGILYIDEVNLLDDHIVNIILDVLAGGTYSREHEGSSKQGESHFTLVGTMNPEEGELRPQLLDRFDLYVEVHAESDQRLAVLKQMVQLDAALAAERRGEVSDWLAQRRSKDAEKREKLKTARQACRALDIGEEVLMACADLADKLGAAGHRGERVLALALRAQAAIACEKTVSVSRDVLEMLARPAFRHRTRLSEEEWSVKLKDALDKVLADAGKPS